MTNQSKQYNKFKLPIKPCILTQHILDDSLFLIGLVIEQLDMLFKAYLKLLNLFERFEFFVIPTPLKLIYLITFPQKLHHRCNYVVTVYIDVKIFFSVFAFTKNMWFVCVSCFILNFIAFRITQLGTCSNRKM